MWKRTLQVLAALVFGAAAAGCQGNGPARETVGQPAVRASVPHANNAEKKQAKTQQQRDNEMAEDFPVRKSETEWRQQLSEQEFHVLREAGTERAFTGKFVDHKAEGTYVCAACGNELFTSEAKFESGTGWPSFWKAVDEDRVVLREDRSHGMTRTEVLCARCGSHLGHVFPDGPQPTGDRYCINSVALDFEAIE